MTLRLLRALLAAHCVAAAYVPGGASPRRPALPLHARAALAVASEAPVLDGGADAAAPPVLSGVTGVQAVAGGYYHSLFLLSTGEYMAAGDNRYGQLGDGSTKLLALPPSTTVRAVDASGAGVAGRRITPCAP